MPEELAEATPEPVALEIPPRYVLALFAPLTTDLPDGRETDALETPPPEVLELFPPLTRDPPDGRETDGLEPPDGLETLAGRVAPDGRVTPF